MANFSKAGFTCWPAAYVLEAVATALDSGTALVLPGGGAVRVTGGHMAFLAHGVDCRGCGLSGHHFTEHPAGRPGRRRLVLRSGSGMPITVDHIVPRRLGGPGILANLQPLCAACNWEKGDRLTTPTVVVYRLGDVRRALVDAYGRNHAGYRAFDAIYSGRLEFESGDFDAGSSPNRAQLRSVIWTLLKAVPHAGFLGRAEMAAYLTEIRNRFALTASLNDLKPYCIPVSAFHGQPPANAEPVGVGLRHPSHADGDRPGIRSGRIQ